MSPRKSSSAKNEEASTPQIDKAKRDVLDKAVGEILKRYGEGSIMKLGEAQNMLNTDSISTGSLSLDIALGVGGVPRGRIIEIYGPARLLLPCMSSLKPRSSAEFART